MLRWVEEISAGICENKIPDERSNMIPAITVGQTLLMQFRNKSLSNFFVSSL